MKTKVVSVKDLFDPKLNPKHNLSAEFVFKNIPSLTTYGYTINDYEQYDKSGFATKEKALKSAVVTVRNLQRTHDDLTLRHIYLLSTAKKSTAQHKELMKFQEVELR